MQWTKDHYKGWGCASFLSCTDGYWWQENARYFVSLTTVSIVNYLLLSLFCFLLCDTT